LAWLGLIWFGLVWFFPLLVCFVSQNKWLDSDPVNVVCVHCDNGRDRSGMMLCAWLLQTKRCLTASHSISFFESVRGANTECIPLPSQRRYPIITEIVFANVYLDSESCFLCKFIWLVSLHFLFI